MRRRIPTFVVVAVMAGGFVLPASASSAPAFRLTLYPAKAIVTLGQRDAAFTLLNGGTEAQRIVVSASDAWLTPSEKTFELAAGERHTTTVKIAPPSSADAGDIDTTITFGALPSAGDSGGALQVTRAIAASVIIETGGSVHHDLRVFGLTAPLIADAWDNPRLSITLDNSRANVHEVVNLAPFGQALLLRGQTRAVSVRWTAHPWLGFGTIHAGREQATTLFLPMRAASFVIVPLVFLVQLVRLLRRRAKRPIGLA